MPAMLMEHDEDPGEMLARKIGRTLKDVDVFNNGVLVAVYERPKKTKSGVILTQTYVEEEQWQGKACVIVKMGNAAFRDPDERWFVGADLKLGDWVVIRPSDGFPISVNSVKCRLVNDTAIRMRIPAPDVVW